MIPKKIFFIIFILFISIKGNYTKNCSQIPFSTQKYSQNNNGACKCIQGFNWNIQLKLCQKICKQINHQIRNINNSTECICIEGYKWNQQKTSCIQKNNILSQQINNKQKQQKFGRLLQTLRSNIYWEDSCKANIECPQDQIWNSSFYQCVLNCSIIIFGGELNPDNYSACICQRGYQWNSDISVCYRNCSTDTNSTGDYKNSATGECNCKDGYSWNSTTLFCQEILITNSKIYIPIIAVTGSVAALALIAWPITIILNKMGIIGVNLAQPLPQSQGIIGASPFSSTKIFNIKGVENIL